MNEEGNGFLGARWNTFNFVADEDDHVCFRSRCRADNVRRDDDANDDYVCGECDSATTTDVILSGGGGITAIAQWGGGGQVLKD